MCSKMLQMLQMLRCVVKSEKAAIAACATCATPLISVHSDANHDPLSPACLFYPLVMLTCQMILLPTNAARHCGKEKFIDDKHETKIAFQLLSPKQPSTSPSPCPSACLPWQTSPCRPSRKKPQSVPQKAPKNEKSCRPRRAKCQSQPPPTANPHKCGPCRFGGEHNMQKIRRKSGRFSPACLPSSSRKKDTNEAEAEAAQELRLNSHYES